MHEPLHGRAFLVSHIHLETLKKEVQRLVDLGELENKHYQNGLSYIYNSEKE